MAKRLDKALLDERVRREIEELRIAGRLHKFTPEPRCKVCKQKKIAPIVNKLLAAGESYKNILDDISPLNEELEEKQRVTYSSIRTHAIRHFNKDEAAAAVYRRILEKNAQREEVDFVDGVTHAVTPLAYLETTMNRGYQKLIDSEEDISVELGMQAAIKLQNLTEGQGDQSLKDVIEKTNRLIEVVRDVVPTRYWQEIVQRLEDETTRGDVIDVEVDEDEDEDEIFDPELEEGFEED